MTSGRERLYQLVCLDTEPKKYFPVGSFNQLKKKKRKMASVVSSLRATVQSAWDRREAVWEFATATVAKKPELEKASQAFYFSCGVASALVMWLVLIVALESVFVVASFVFGFMVVVSFIFLPIVIGILIIIAGASGIVLGAHVVHEMARRPYFKIEVKET